MKKFFTMALMSLAVSCSKDSPEELIEGTWVMDGYTFTENGEVINKSATECEKKGTWSFSQGKGTIVNYPSHNGVCNEAKTKNSTYTISGDKLTLSEEGKSSDTVTFSVDKNILKLTTKDGVTVIFKRK